MANPTPKDPKLDEEIKELTGFDRIRSITSNTCVFCKKEVTEDSFRDEISKKEYRISGICRKCQDEVFG